MSTQSFTLKCGKKGSKAIATSEIPETFEISLLGREKLAYNILVRVVSIQPLLCSVLLILCSYVIMSDYTIKKKSKLEYMYIIGLLFLDNNQFYLISVYLSVYLYHAKVILDCV